MKVWKVFLLACCVSVLLVHAAPAETLEQGSITNGNWVYEQQKDGTAVITLYRGNAEEVTVPAELDGRKVTGIGSSAFYSCSSLTDVVIQEGITTIADYAFYGCRSLVSVTIPDSVEAVGENPFMECGALIDFIISPEQPFLAVQDGALFSRADMRLICSPAIFTAGEHTIPDGTRLIGSNAFFGCDSLTSVTIPEGVTGIGDNAFGYCSALVSVSIPNSVTEIGTNPFMACSRLTELNVAPDHPYLEVMNGSLCTKTDRRLICCLCTLTAGTYEIPEDIQVLGDEAFNQCTSLTSVTIPEGVTSIGQGAFRDCYSLETVTIPDSVTSIGETAFFGCDGVKITASRDSYAARFFKEYWNKTIDTY